jgi:hypothetical protein
MTEQSGVRPARTPEQIEAARLRMAKVRAARKKSARTKKDMREARHEAMAAPHADIRGAVSFTGLTSTTCCDECYRTGKCVISGDICVHPNKTGLQAVHQRKPEAVARFAEAKKLLAHIKVDAV